MACDVCKKRAVHKISEISVACDSSRVMLHANVQDVSGILSRRKDDVRYSKMVLRDAGSTEIEALVFSDNVDLIMPLIKQNQSYKFKYFNVTKVKKKYPDIKHPCEIWFEDFTKVQRLNNDVVDTSPFVPFKDLGLHLFYNHIRIIGILSNEGQFISKRETTFGKMDFRKIRLMDKHGDEQDIALWATKASDVRDDHRGSVIVVRGVKVDLFNGEFSLSSTYRTIIEIDPEIPETAELKKLKQELDDRGDKRSHDDGGASGSDDDESRKKRRSSDGRIETDKWEVRTMIERMSSMEERSNEEGIPEEISCLDPKIEELYIKTVTEGTEEQTSIRVMIIGHTEAGKTTLTKNMLQVDLPEIEQSTNGIDVHVHHANIVDGKLEILDTNDTPEKGMKRLAKVAKQKSDQESVSSSVSGESAMPTSDDVTDSGYGSIASYNNAEPSCSYDNDTADRDMVKHTTKAIVKDQFKPKGNATETKKGEVEDTVKKPALPSSSSLKEFHKAFKDNQDVSRMLSVWDFGGQFSFYVTHQLFLSDYAIYLLVVDLTKDLNTEVKDAFSSDKSRDVKTFCKFWLETIHAFVGNSSGNPPVVLVGTRFDQLDNNDDKEDLADAKLDQVMDLFDNTPVQKHIHHERFHVSKEQSQVEVSKLMTCITKLATQQKPKVPASWIPLEDKLLERETRSKEHITFQELCELDDECDFPIKDKEKLKVFLTFQHRKGNIVYFTDEGLSDIVVLNPQWIVDAFKCIITAEKFCRHRSKLKPLWQQLETEAVLRQELITDVWQNDDKNDFVHNKDVLLLFLQRLGVISEKCTIRVDDITPGVESQDSEKCYIVPSKLQRDSCSKIKKLEQSFKSKTLQFVFWFKNGFIPETLYHKVIASAVNIWKLFEWEKKTMLYRDGAVFILDIQHVGEIVLTQSSIKISVVNLTEEDVNRALSDKLRRFVHRIITEELNRFRDGNLKNLYELAFCCDENTCEKPPHPLNTVNKCEDGKSVPCAGSPTIHKISVDRLMQEWFPNELRNIRFVDLMQNNPSCRKYLPDRMTGKYVNRFAYAIKNPIKVLGAAFGIDKEDIERLEKTETLEHSKIRDLIFIWQKEKTYRDFLKVLDENPSVHVNKDKLLNIYENLS